VPTKTLIHSVPGPDRSISVEDLFEGKAQVRIYRNRRIGEFLKELELTEGRGTGIPLIRDELRRNGSPAVKFHTNDERSFFVTEIPIHSAFVPVPEVLGAHDVAHDVSRIELKILSFCANGERSIAEIEAHVGFEGRSGTLKRALERLKQLGAATLSKLQRRAGDGKKSKKKRK
jgi:ATP-dependent DNA helicase RecG